MSSFLLYAQMSKFIVVKLLSYFLLIARRCGRSPSKSFLHFDGYSGTSGAPLMGELYACMVWEIIFYSCSFVRNRYTKLCRLSKLPCVLTFLDCRSNTSAKKCVCDGYRRFLAMGSRACQVSCLWVPRFTLSIRVSHIYFWYHHI